MTLSCERRLTATAFTWLVVLAGCADHSLPTDVPVQRQTPASPTQPAPPTASPQDHSTGGDNRRSFVWREESGFTIIPNPPGVLLVSAYDINDDGEVSGTMIMDASAGPPIYRGFRWSAGRGFSYIVGAGGINTYGKGINNSGDVVGFTEWGGERQVFVWNEKSGPRPVGVRLPYLNVIGIDDSGIFGNTLYPSASGAGVAPFRQGLVSGRLEVLPATSEAGGGVMDVNGAGESSGYDGYIDYGFGGTSDAVMWDQSGQRTVAYDCRAEWDCFAYLSSINAQGIALGSVKRGDRDDTRVFKWSRSKGIEYLDIPDAGYRPAAVDVNDDGSILVLNGRDGFMFKPSGSVTVIRPPSTHRLLQPRAMNRHGHVVGMIF